ncbi:excinuclease ABC subunit C [bacterium]|nr:excinuclease ABC subunit C [bacterium]
MPEKTFCVYILASKRYGVLYIGVTSDLVGRVWQHQNQYIKGFTSKYNVDKLVYYEVCEDVYEAIRLEKQLKKWNRDWKIQLIEINNPEWNDLSGTI